MINNSQSPFQTFYQTAMRQALPVAIWRLPYGQSKAIVDSSGSVRSTTIDFEQKQPGFTISPFVNQDGQATLFIQASVLLQQHGLEIFEETSATVDFVTMYEEAKPQTTMWHQADHTQPQACYTEAEFCHMVQLAIDYMQDTDLQKIVTSRAIEVALPSHFQPMVLFETLCQAYPHAFISLVSIPGIGTWLGASPEILLTLNNQALNTIALAGTQAYQPHLPLPTVEWGEKEIVEQALVSDYIRQFLTRLNLKYFNENGPETVAAGNVVHLKTSFTIEEEPARLLRIGNNILNSLHPTSAVCGMPKREALDFILAHEGYDREFYAGYLGPIWIDGQSSLFVNLRCMQLLEKTAILYAGAGITPDSDPHAEWRETELKSKTLLSILQS